MQYNDAFLAKQLAFFRLPVVILDLEATGGHFMHDRITEIAFLRFDGQNVERFTQLVNPQKEISEFVTQLTGISNEMVANAPTFADVIPHILPMLRGSLLVAHNSRFDYTLLRNEFRRAGVPFATPTLCTVKLSRTLYPNEHKHNLDAVANRFGLTSDGNRHRAWADVAILADFLQAALLDNADRWQKIALSLIQPPVLPTNIPENIHHDLLEFSDDFGVVAIHLAQRVELLICENAYRETIAWLLSHISLLNEIKRLDFYPTVGMLHNIATFARLAREFEQQLGASGRHTIEFYEQQGCLKAKVTLLKNGFYTAPPTGVFIYPKAAKKAVQEWATTHEICPTWLGVLPYTLPKSAPCPVALAKTCACESQDLNLHNQKVMQFSDKLPTADWLNSPRLFIRETDELSGQFVDFTVERGALLLDNGKWFVHYELFSILKQKFKFQKETIRDN